MKVTEIGVKEELVDNQVRGQDLAHFFKALTWVSLGVCHSDL